MIPVKRTLKPEAGPPVLMFKLSTATSTKSLRKRAKYGPERRHEVNFVRQNRACLRCALLKLKCTNDDICLTCSDLNLDIHNRKMLSFSGCIRTRLSEVSIFEDFLPNEEIRESLSHRAKILEYANISLQFESHVNWELGTLIENIVAWLHDSEHTETSKVGTLSSPKFSALIAPSIDEPQRKDFQTMLYTESLAFTQPFASHNCTLSVKELRQIGAINGHEVLKHLDKRLKPQSLKDASFIDIQVLFLVVFGTILATTYTFPSPLASNVSKKGSKEMVSVEIAGKYSHLCQILAHYLVYLGSCLKLSLKSDLEHLLLKTVTNRWNKSGSFEWDTASEVFDDASATVLVIFDSCNSGFHEEVGRRPFGEFEDLQNSSRESIDTHCVDRRSTHWEPSVNTFSFPMDHSNLFAGDNNNASSSGFLAEDREMLHDKITKGPSSEIHPALKINKNEKQAKETLTSNPNPPRRTGNLQATSRTHKKLRSTGASSRCRSKTYTEAQRSKALCKKCVKTPPAHENFVRSLCSGPIDLHNLVADSGTTNLVVVPVLGRDGHFDQDGGASDFKSMGLLV